MQVKKRQDTLEPFWHFHQVRAGGCGCVFFLRGFTYRISHQTKQNETLFFFNSANGETRRSKTEQQTWMGDQALSSLPPGARVVVKPPVLSHPKMQHSWRGRTAHVLRDFLSEDAQWVLEEEVKTDHHACRFHIEEIESKKDGNVVVHGFFNARGKTVRKQVTPMMLVLGQVLYGAQYIVSDKEEDDAPVPVLPAKRLPPLTCADTGFLSQGQRAKLDMVLKEVNVAIALMDKIPQLHGGFDYRVE